MINFLIKLASEKKLEEIFDFLRPKEKIGGEHGKDW